MKKALKSQSRWANDDNDAQVEARHRQQKQDRRRRKEAAKARQAELAQADDHDADDGTRQCKRRKLTADLPTKLLRPESVMGWNSSRSIDCYEKLNDIQEGTYGWVARARERATSRIVALKRLKQEAQGRNGLPVTGLREIQMLNDCRHINIVALHQVVVGNDAPRLDNSVYLVLEFIEHDLKGILDDMPEPFLASEIKCLLIQLASGLAYLHDRWILHRDLKTSNLLLNNRGQLKIADFGMARYVGDPPPCRLTQLVVTLWYRAPELLLGTLSYGPAIDMWSVGCIFGELLSREPILQGANEVGQLSKIIALCGIPSDESWPGFRRLPNASSLKLPPSAISPARSLVRSRFPSLTTAGVSLLSSLLSLDPHRRPTAQNMLQHEYFSQDPKPKPESLFPTFPSKASQERRRRPEPHAPVRGRDAHLGNVDLSHLLQGRDQEEKGPGFTLRMA
ncbi:hypothetical protein CDD82_7289 [Ophiocordyceps australis]|uniref:cyclin-dependent kinase n=1 Tax=Ophiocordyceps australis TaxID=1399860 RepID=A0A2C5YRN9_9HYPO|nr:hypothetical protein CDD82_7289 [Ophiocordyceps australis]